MTETVRIYQKRNPYPLLLRCDKCGKCLSFYSGKSKKYYDCASKCGCGTRYISIDCLERAISENLVRVLTKCKSGTIFTDSEIPLLSKVHSIKQELSETERQFFKIYGNENFQTPLSTTSLREISMLKERAAFYQQLLEESENRLLDFALKRFYANRFIELSSPYWNSSELKIDAVTLSDLLEKILVCEGGRTKFIYKYIGEIKFT